METHSIGDTYQFLPTSNELVIRESNQVKTIKLEPLISDLLLVLITRPDEVIQRKELINQLWHGNLAVGDPALTKSIFKLRKLFGQRGKAMFETVSKQGYRYNSKTKVVRTSIRPHFSVAHSGYWKILMLLLLIILIAIVALIIDPKLLHKISH